MNKIIILLGFVFFVSCKNKESNNVKIAEKTVIADKKSNGIIYEANIRQYSPEGTFKAFEKDIPEIKKLGAKYVWLMPIFPISKTKRKATGGMFAHELENEFEKNKMLGSYYAISDYEKVNPEFGTIEDFRSLVKTIHDNDMLVVLDWVANHTGWDHSWIASNPEFYTKNREGEITDPLNENGDSMGWEDVADLNYNNLSLRKSMSDAMLFWVVNEDIDGFRCDVAGEVPLDFWEETIPLLRNKKDLFMLAEAWEPEMINHNLFDMVYSWDTHHVMNEIAAGEKDVIDWNTRMIQIDTLYKKGDMLMNFVTNHDENSWAGTVNERMGNAAEIFTVLNYLTPGMPLIYSGQEYGLSHRLKFFEKDEIPRDKGKEWKLLIQLGRLKTKYSCLNNEYGKSAYIKLNTSDNKDILAFKRVSDKDTIYFVGNLSNKRVEFKPMFNSMGVNILSSHKDEINYSNDDIEVIELKPWEYLVHGSSSIE